MRLRPSTLLAMAGSVLLPACAFFETPKADSFAGDPLKIVPFAKVKDSHGSAEAWYTLGRHLQRSGRLDEAAKAYRRALEVDADYTEAKNGLAAVTAGKGDIDQAIAILEELNQLRPGQAHVLANLGYARALKGQYVEARMVLEQAVALEPDNTSIRTKLDEVRAAMGDPAAEPATDPLPEVPVTIALADGRAEEVIVPLSPGIYELRQQGVIAVPAPVLEEIRSTASAREATDIGAGTQPAVPATADIRGHAQASAVVQPQASVSSSNDALVQRLGERVEIVNGNGVTGLGRSLRALIAGDWKVIRVLNHESYTVRSTRIEYAKSHYAAARQLASDLGVSAQLRPKQGIDDVHLRVVLGHDYRNLDPLRSRLTMAVALAE